MIKVTDLSVDFGPVRALSHVSFAVPGGQIVCLVGSNGSGKTTLLRTIAGLQRPTSGAASVGGNSSWSHRRKVWQLIDFLEAEQHLPESHDAVQAILLFEPNLSRKEAREKAQALFAPEVLDLPEEHRDRPVAELSTGMRQKVRIATLRNVPYWLLDEPTQGFDPNIAQEFRAFVLAQERTVIWVTHNMHDAERANRLLVLNNGSLVASGPPADLRRWLGVKSLEQVYSVAAAKDSPLCCETVPVLADDRIQPGSYVSHELEAPEIALEEALLRRDHSPPLPDLAEEGVAVHPDDMPPLHQNTEDSPYATACWLRRE